MLARRFGGCQVFLLTLPTLRGHAGTLIKTSKAAPPAIPAANEGASHEGAKLSVISLGPPGVGTAR